MKMKKEKKKKETENGNGETMIVITVRVTDKVRRFISLGTSPQKLSMLQGLKSHMILPTPGYSPPDRWRKKKKKIPQDKATEPTQLNSSQLTSTHLNSPQLMVPSQQQLLHLPSSFRLFSLLLQLALLHVGEISISPRSCQINSAALGSHPSVGTVYTPEVGFLPGYWGLGTMVCYASLVCKLPLTRNELDL